MRIDRTFPLNWSYAKDRLYLYEWGQARRVLRKQGHSPVEVDAMRHELHIKALGRDKSHYSFTNSDFDKVLGVFRAISKPDDLFSQLHALNGRCLRMRFGIKRAAAKMNKGEDYILGVARHTHPDRKIDSLDQLDEAGLEKVRLALTETLRVFQRAEKAKAMEPA